jgi:hypothetical protein
MRAEGFQGLTGWRVRDDGRPLEKESVRVV